MKMIEYIHEYRINKKGCECFRTGDIEEAKQKLKELSEKKPGIYEMQSRSCRLDKYGNMERDWKHRPIFSPWH